MKQINEETPYIEKNCCITFENKKFCSGGSIITENRIIAYLSSDGEKITTWKGETISTKVKLLSKRFQAILGTGYY